MKLSNVINVALKIGVKLALRNNNCETYMQTKASEFLYLSTFHLPKNLITCPVTISPYLSHSHFCLAIFLFAWTLKIFFFFIWVLLPALKQLFVDISKSTIIENQSYCNKGPTSLTRATKKESRGPTQNYA